MQMDWNTKTRRNPNTWIVSLLITSYYPKDLSAHISWVLSLQNLLQLYMWNPDVNYPTCNNNQPNQLICVKCLATLRGFGGFLGISVVIKPNPLVTSREWMLKNAFDREGIPLHILQASDCFLVISHGIHSQSMHHLYPTSYQKNISRTLKSVARLISCNSRHGLGL